MNDVTENVFVVPAMPNAPHLSKLLMLYGVS
jgi:hypothetical protein